MPAGLDGNPDPIRTPERDALLSSIADRVNLDEHARVLVGIDGRSGAGKSTFGDELATRLIERGTAVLRSTTDSFHRPRRDRLARGVTSAAGYYLDSHDLERIVSELLSPFRQGADHVLVAAFNEPTDTPVEHVVAVPPHAVLVFDGLFVHRPEFAAFWDFSVYLESDDRRDSEWLRFLLSGLPDGAPQRAAELDRRLVAARWPRYRHGWMNYVDDVAPRSRATVVIDNNEISRPTFVDRSR